MQLKNLFLSVLGVGACLCAGVSYAVPQDPANNCADGKFWNGSECEMCPAGMYCMGGQSHLCGPGLFYQDMEGQSECKDCAYGTYPFPSHIRCDACNVGNFAIMEYNGEMVCNVCSDSKPYANETHNDCVACDDVHEFVLADGVCKVCPDDVPYINDAYTECVACNVGNYVSDENGVCKSCDEPNAPYANETHTQCVMCDNPVDGVCHANCAPNEYVNDNGVCVVCPVGYYMDDSRHCVICDAGYYCPGNGVRKRCASGSYSQEGQRACTRCPIGYYIDDTKQLVLCNAGYYCNGDGTQRECVADSFSATGQGACSKCPDGYVKIKDSGTEYVAGESLDNLCKKIEIKIKIGSTTTEIPKCLKPGKINTRVVRQR